MVRVRDISDIEAQVIERRRVFPNQEQNYFNNYVLYCFFLVCIISLVYITILITLILIHLDKLFPNHDPSDNESLSLG